MDTYCPSHDVTYRCIDGGRCSLCVQDEWKAEQLEKERALGVHPPEHLPNEVFCGTCMAWYPRSHMTFEHGLIKEYEHWVGGELVGESWGWKSVFLEDGEVGRRLMDTDSIEKIAERNDKIELAVAEARLSFDVVDERMKYVRTHRGIRPVLDINDQQYDTYLIVSQLLVAVEEQQRINTLLLHLLGKETGQLESQIEKSEAE